MNHENINVSDQRNVDRNVDLRNIDVPDQLNVDHLNRDVPDQLEANLDPISGEPGAHPLGTSVGAAGVGSVATVVGSVVAGPVGALVGAVVGSVVGGLAGKSTAEKINPTFEDEHWRDNYGSRPYVEKGAVYADYQHAYRAGYEGFDRYGHNGCSYEDIEPRLRRDYEETQNGAGMSWERAKQAVRDAWERAATSTSVKP